MHWLWGLEGVDCGMMIEVEEVPLSPTLIRKPHPRLNAGSAQGSGASADPDTTQIDSRDG